MSWGVSALFLTAAVLLWLIARDNSDDVIGLLEKIIAGHRRDACSAAQSQCALGGGGFVNRLFLAESASPPLLNQDELALGFGFHFPDGDPAGTREDRMGCLHGMAKIHGLDHFLAPVLAAVICHRVLMHLFVIHP
jgi:hypothetical protein